jgi:hypothetical protein
MRADQSVAGYVGGDLSAMFGELELRSTAVVKGDLLVSPGGFEREPGAQIDGEQVHEFSVPAIPLIAERLEGLTSQMPTPPPTIREPETAGQRVGRFLGRVLAAMVMGVVFTGIGALIVFIWPRATREVADCIAMLPVQSFGLGLLTYLIAAVLESLAAVIMILIILLGAALIGTVILLPVGLLLIVLSGLILLPVPLVLAAAMIVGWVSLAVLIGERVLRALRIQNVARLGAAIVGLLITVGITCLLWVFQPACCAWPFVILLSSLGVGAAIHTRFGRKSCRPAKTESKSDALPPEAMAEELGRPDGPMDTT